jgi:hypothetical protein
MPPSDYLPGLLCTGRQKIFAPNLKLNQRLRLKLTFSSLQTTLYILKVFIIDPVPVCPNIFMPLHFPEDHEGLVGKMYHPTYHPGCPNSKVLYNALMQLSIFPLAINCCT